MHEIILEIQRRTSGSAGAISARSDGGTGVRADRLEQRSRCATRTSRGASRRTRGAYFLRTLVII